MNKVAKKKLNVLAKEFEVAPAEVIALIKEKTGVEKKTTNVLTEAEMNLVTSHYMMSGQVSDLTDYFSAKPQPKSEKPAEKPAEKPSKKPSKKPGIRK